MDNHPRGPDPKDHMPVLPIMLEPHGEHPRRTNASGIVKAVHLMGPRKPTLIANRSPYRLHDYIQALRDDEGPFTVEYLRPGSPQLGTSVSDVDAVVGLFTGWAGQKAGWDEGHEWSETGFVPSRPSPIAPEHLPTLRRMLQDKVDEGFMLFEDIVTWAVHSGEKPRLSRLSVQAELAVIWDKRVAEQRRWPAQTDCDRLSEAFASLRDYGFTAEENFTCCMTCGVAEIRGHAHDDDDGYAFYHMQDTERAVQDGDLHIAFGTYGEADPVELGTRIVRILTDRGLSTEWDGTSESRIRVSGLTWQRRLR